MKKLHSFILIFLSIYTQITTSAADNLNLQPGEYVTTSEYSRECMTSQVSRATCLKVGQGVISCRPAPEIVHSGIAFGPEGRKFIPTIVKCGGNSNISQACIPHASLYLTGESCKIGTGVIESITDFQARVSCYGEDVKSATLSACPKGCEKYQSTLRSLHVCDWTISEFNDYQKCGLDYMAVIVRAKLCPNSRANLNQEVGSAPRINTSGTPVNGKDGKSLFNTYQTSFRLELSSTRGDKGSYCIYPRGEQCTSAVSYDSNGSSFFAKDITGLSPGTYTIEAKSLQNGLTSSKDVAVSAKMDATDLCRMTTGTFCPPSLKQTEIFYLCGEVPSGNGWAIQPDGSYHRLTGQSCNVGEDNVRTVVEKTNDEGEKYSGVWRLATGPEFSPRAVVSDKSASDFDGQKCSSFYQEQKDKNGTRWVCERFLASTSAQLAPKQCLLWNFTSLDGSHDEYKLNEGAVTNRKIISPTGDSLINQEVTCLSGVLTDTSLVNNLPSPAAGAKCDYWNFTSIQGAYNEFKLNEGATITRKIISPDATALINQEVTCKNGVLTDTSLL